MIVGLRLTWTWADVVSTLKQQPPGTVLRMKKCQVEHPAAGGLTLSIGLPKGQWADYRLRLSDCTGLHVHDFGTQYQAHIDSVHPGYDFLEHLRQDAPGTYVGVAAAIGALAGTLLGKKPEAVLAGAVIGGLIGGLATARSEEAPKHLQNPVEKGRPLFPYET